MEEKALEILKNERARITMMRANGLSYFHIEESSVRFFKGLGFDSEAGKLFDTLYRSISKKELNDAREVINQIKEGVNHN
ncbi:MAG: hypothetical protein ACRDD8_02905 [Bacteroidales bacterium]